MNTDIDISKIQGNFSIVADGVNSVEWSHLDDILLVVKNNSIFNLVYPLRNNIITTIDVKSQVSLEGDIAAICWSRTAKNHILISAKNDIVALIIDDNSNLIKEVCSCKNVINSEDNIGLI